MRLLRAFYCKPISFPKIHGGHAAKGLHLSLCLRSLGVHALHRLLGGLFEWNLQKVLRIREPQLGQHLFHDCLFHVEHPDFTVDHHRHESGFVREHGGFFIEGVHEIRFA